MTNIRMKAGDTIHISSVKADNIAPGEEFVVSTAVADDLEARGLASRVGEAEEAKAEPEPANKAVKAAPANKTKRAK
jgi:hypothetical protein